MNNYLCNFNHMLKECNQWQAKMETVFVLFKGHGIEMILQVSKAQRTWRQRCFSQYDVAHHTLHYM